jgi:hypothetical protein
MNRQKLQALASEWVRLAKNDIRNKVMDFMREVDTTPHELAYVLAISEGELEQILRGNGEITLTTFAKLLIATGNALEIKPIEETPIGDYDNIPEEPIRQPQPNVFERPRPSNVPPIVPPRFARPNSTQEPTRGHFAGQNVMTQHPQQPRVGHFQNMPPIFPPIDEIPEEIREEMEERFGHRMPQPRDARGRFASFNPRPQQPTSPFARMTRAEMTNIIKERLWDSEIDIDNVSDEQLVRFLDEKNRRMKEYKRNKEAEIDPAVNDFKNKLKNTVNNNPHLREWVKKLVSGIEED